MLRSALAIILGLVIAASAIGATADAPVKKILPNGLTLIVKPEPGSGIVAVEVFVKVGAAQERESTAGIGGLVARTLLASTRNKRAETVATIIDGVGGNFQTEWHPDYTEITAITTSSGFDDAISLLGDILLNANFEQEWVNPARQEILARMSIESDDIFQTTYEQIKAKLYRDNPYKRPSLGYGRVLRSITADDLQQFYSQWYVPNNMVVSVVGDVTPEHAEKRLRMAFAGTSAKSLPRQRPNPPETISESKGEVMEKPISAAYFLFGFLAPGMESPEYASAQVASAALGSGKGSRMFRNLRERKGLAYELGTIYPQMKSQSHVLAYLVTDPYRRLLSGFSMQMMLSDVKQALLDEVTRMQTEPLTPEELERAKKYTIGTYALRHQRLRDRAFHLGWLEAIGIGSEFDSDFAAKIEAVTAVDVQKVARKYFNNYAMTIVLPRNFEDNAVSSEE